MKLQLVLLAIACALASASCIAPKAYAPGTPNPLDTPADSRTAAEIRQEHMRAITGNPGWR
jgi:hypothetical protein